MTYRLIYNPAAGGGRAQAVVDRLAAQLADIEGLEVVATREPGHATELARAVALSDDSVVISVGGDGTHHEVVNGLMPAGQAELAVIPAGSGNDFAASLGIPMDPAQALHLALTASTRTLDVGVAETEGRTTYFLTVVGAGFDAEVAGFLNSRPKGRGNGKLLYLKGILTTLLRYRSQDMAVTTGDRSTARSTLLIACGNTPRYAGGILICPGARLDDGQLNVVWVAGVPPLRVLPILAQAYKGAHIHNPAVESFQAQSLTIDGPDRLFVHADGEILGHLPLSVHILPQALRIRCPAPT